MSRFSLDPKSNIAAMSLGWNKMLQCLFHVFETKSRDRQSLQAPSQPSLGDVKMEKRGHA